MCNLCPSTSLTAPCSYSEQEKRPRRHDVQQQIGPLMIRRVTAACMEALEADVGVAEEAGLISSSQYVLVMRLYSTALLPFH